MTRRPPRSTLSLHDALPILADVGNYRVRKISSSGLITTVAGTGRAGFSGDGGNEPDRKSTRLNSSHTVISYAVFCLKKKKAEPDRLQERAHPHGRQVRKGER